jgi:hypothetical protein
LRTPFSIIAMLSEPRGRDVVDILGEHGDDLMAAALSLDQRGIPCRRVFDLLDDAELRAIGSSWLPLDIMLPTLKREDLIGLLCDQAGEH